MLTMDYIVVEKDDLKLKSSNRCFSEGGLSVHVFEKPVLLKMHQLFLLQSGYIINDFMKLSEGLNTFDLIFTLTYLNMKGDTHNEAYANLKTITLNVEVKGDEIFISIPYFEGNLPKEPRWEDKWQVKSWTSDSYFASSNLHPDDVISNLVNERFKKAKIDLSYEFLLKFLEKSLIFKKDDKKIGFFVKHEEPKEK